MMIPLCVFQAGSKAETVVCENDQQIGKNEPVLLEQEEEDPDFGAEDRIGGGNCRGSPGSRLRMVYGFLFTGPTV